MSVRCALFDWSDVVEKVSKQKLNTAALVFVFLIGLFLVIWPVATELTSYQVDEDEYEAMCVVDKVNAGDNTVRWYGTILSMLIRQANEIITLIEKK